MWIVLVAFILLLIIGVPVAFVIGISSFLLFSLSGNELMIMPQQMVSGVNSFPLMAIPIFILAGELMNFGGITNRIFDFARVLVGHIRGGLAHANVLASMAFAGMSGSAVSDAAGLGTVEIKAMKEQNYTSDFSVGITLASSTIGPIIPPSISLIIYGSLASVSTAALFIGGIIPGILMGLSLMILIHIYAIRQNFPKDERSKLPVIWKSFLRAFFPLLTPAIIIFGILFGIATPTEVSVFAVIYALFLGTFVYKEITLKKIYDILVRTSILTGAILLIISVASPFGFMLSKLQIPQSLLKTILSFTDNMFILWILLLVLLLFLGLFMEATTILIVLVPILLPTLVLFDINLVHFGVVTVLALSIGLLTPPVGILLFVGSKIGEISLERVIKATTPFLIPLIIVLITITFFPQLVLFIPDLFDVG